MFIKLKQLQIVKIWVELHGLTWIQLSLRVDDNLSVFFWGDKKDTESRQLSLTDALLYTCIFLI